MSEQPTNETLADEDADPSRTGERLQRGAVIGRYVVLSKLGAGAMGVVYAAYDPELDRRVALKLVHSRDELGGTRGATRLQREAQAMARLSHPNVLAIHDVGSYGGRVFLAMEFVEGRTLSEHPTLREGSWREILRLFLHAGEGLYAAHSAGLIHRDFKPDNVLVGNDGRVRVTDFGIARQAGRESSDVPETTKDSKIRPRAGVFSVELTRPGALAGTPAFMAPEQFLGGFIDARTDQFSFCVALWRALYREHPFGGESLAEIAVAVTSGALREPGTNSATPARIRRALTRGLAVAPTRRWPDMRELLDELQHDPARRQVRIAGVAALVAAGVGVAWWWPHAERVCAAAEEKLDGVWDPATRDGVRDSFLARGSALAADTWERAAPRVDAYANAWQAMYVDACEATHVRGEQSTALLDLRMACLGHVHDELGALVRVFAEADERVVEKAVQAVGELPPLQRCADTDALLRRLPPPADATAAAEAEAIRAELIGVHALERGGRVGEAAEAIGLIALRARTLGYAPVLAEALALAGEVAEQEGRFPEAEAQLREAYFLALRSGHDEIAALTSTTLVFVVGHRQARAEAGREWALHAEAEVGRFAPGGREEARLRKSVGTMLHRQGALAEARDACLQAVDIGIAALGEDDVEVALARACVGTVLVDLQDYAGARRQFEQALVAVRSSLGASHPANAQIYNGLGNAAYREKQLDVATDHYEAALAIWSATEREHPAMAMVLNNLGNIADDRGDAARAEASYRRAVEVGTRALGPDHPDVSTALVNLGILLDRSGDDAAAYESFARALAIREKAFGDVHASLVRPLLGVARAELRRGDPTAARRDGERMLAFPPKLVGPSSATAADALTIVGTAQEALGEHAAAVRTLEQALAIFPAGDSSLAAGHVAAALSSVLAASDRDRARALRVRAREIFVARGHGAERELRELDATPAPRPDG